MKSFYQAITLIIGFIAVILAAYFTTRLIGTKVKHFNHGKYIKVLDKVMLGNDKLVCIVQVGSLCYLLGVTNHRIDLLGQIEEKDIIPLTFEDKPSFNSFITKYMTKNNNSKTDYLSIIKQGINGQRDIIKKAAISKEKGNGSDKNE